MVDSRRADDHRDAVDLVSRTSTDRSCSESRTSTCSLGMLVNRALLPQVVLQTGGFDEMNDVAIDLWMGASPIYTAACAR